MPGPFLPSTALWLRLRIFTFTAACILTLCAQAQTPIPDSFNPGANFGVYSLALQTDGKILVGGNFTTLGGQPRNHIARLKADGTLDSGFNPGAAGDVYSLALQMDGKILVGGNFTTLGGQPRNYIARLNADGTLDSSLNSGANYFVHSLAVQMDGKILAAGWFTSFGGQPRNGIARLNADGTLDSSFDPKVNFQLNSFAIQPNGKILVGGYFSTFDGQPRNGIARLNADGTLDSGFNPGASSISSAVYSLALQSDGKILLGGYFTTLGGQPRNYIARLNADGTLESSFNPRANAPVSLLSLQANGKILVGGSFTNLGGQPRNYIARLNADGTLDSGFNPGADNVISSLAMQTDGKILVGGSFTNLGGQPRNRVARLNNTDAATQNLSSDDSSITWLRGGTSPEAWHATFEHSVDGLTWSMLGSGTRILGGWRRTNVSLPFTGTVRARGFIFGGYHSGSGWFVEDYLGSLVFVSHPTSQTNNAGETGTFHVMAGGSQPLSYQWFKDGITLLDGGDITGAASPTLTLSNLLHASAGGYSVVVSNSQGSLTSLVAQLTVIDPYISVHPLSQLKDTGQSVLLNVMAAGTQPLEYQWWHQGLLLTGATNATLTLTNLQGADAGNYFATIRNPYGSVTSAVALLTLNFASLDNGFNPNVESLVLSLAVQADGKILVGGSFTSLDEQPRNCIARLHADGTLDSGFNPGANSSVYSLVVQMDGKILVGGYFTSLGGQPRSYIARLNADGTLDAGFNPGANNPVNSVVLQADGKILVGGDFIMLGGQLRSGMARLNADGTLDSSFNPGADGTVRSLAIQEDGKILVGGWFTTLGGQARNSIARLNADGALDSSYNPGANNIVFSLAMQADGKILVGGGFTTLAGQSRRYLARLDADGTLDSSFNPGSDNTVGSLAMQTDGKILVGGNFTILDGQLRRYLARLNANGALDSGFNPAADNTVRSMAIQGDGKILVGGDFTSLSRQPRNHVARLSNSDAATQNLSSNGSRITWLRGGTSPEVWRTTFEHSADGLAWSLLGAGARIPGGWQLTNVSLPSTGTMRARGYVSGGLFNGSSWFVEDYLGSLVFVSQPASQANGAGNIATFWAVAGGGQPLSYQWFKDSVALLDGGDITGAASPTLTLSNLLHASEGSYSVIVSNSQGSVTSLLAQLNVIDPYLSVQPLSQLKDFGQSALLNVRIAGTQPLEYQWWHNAERLEGATNASLSLTNLQRADAGNYFATARNPFGSVTSAVALLTLNFATLESGFNPGANLEVKSLAIQADGKILVGGWFTSLGGELRNYIARLHADGTLDSGFNPGANRSVFSLLVQMDGKILVGGLFTSLGGQPRNYIARLNADGTLDSGFDPGANNQVYSLAVQPDGKILVGGLFTSLGGQPRNYIARLNADGTLDSGFNPGANNPVNSVAIQPDGKILVGGLFTSLGGQPRNYIARLNADGTLDSGFNPGASSAVNTLMIQTDGKILVGGSFTTLGGLPRNTVARLNADGTLDSGFNPGVNSNVSVVDSLAVQADGRILVGGIFNKFSGQLCGCIARLNADGTLDSGFNPGVNSNVSIVDSLAVQADGRILVGGAFASFSGQPRNHIARLHNAEPATQNLSHDGSTVTWLRGGTSPEVWRTTFDFSADGVLWTNVGAGAHSLGGWQLTNVALPSTGTLRARGYVSGGYQNGSGWFVENYLGSLAFLSQPASQTNNAGESRTFQVVMAGSSTPKSYQWLKDGIALLNGADISGATSPTLTLSNLLHASEGGYSVVASNSQGSVTSLVAQLTVMDPFISVQPLSQFMEFGQSVILSVNATGTPPLEYQWWYKGLLMTGATNASLTLTNLQATDAGEYMATIQNPYSGVTSAVALLTVYLIESGFNPGASNTVYSLAVQADGKIVVGGEFTTLGGQPRNYLARLNADGTLDNGFNPGASNTVYSLAVQADGKILVGGYFTNLCGQARNYLGRLNADGTLDNGFNPGASSAVNSLVIQADGKILVGGLFFFLSGQPRKCVARLNTDGTLDNGFNPGASSAVNSLAIQADGKILVGGTFATLGGQPRDRVGRLNADGTLDSGFNPRADSTVYSLAIQADGKILAGGLFTALGGQPRNRVARLNADGTVDSGFNPAANGIVYSLALQGDGKILMGGGFTTLGGQPRNYSARLNADGTLDSGFNPRADSTVYSLALQVDGKILVGGSFTNLDGKPHNRLARLHNTEVAIQNLSHDGSTITWLRGGTSPEVWRTTFDHSADGLAWSLLGTGARIPGGWQLTNVSLPSTGTLRAQGAVSGGYYNGSGGIVETLWPSDLEAVPKLGVRPAGTTSFTLLLEGVSDTTYTLQSTTNLAPASTWSTVWTGVLSNSVQTLEWTNRGETQRYFRVLK